MRSPIGLGPLRHALTGTLDIGYFALGNPDGTPVLLLHGYPYDVHSYNDVAPLLAQQGYRVVVPYLRGHGPTVFRDASTHRSGQQGALGSDVVELMDALGVRDAIVAGYDWGGRAACVAAALWPERVRGLVSVNGYLIQDIAASGDPLPPTIEAGFWYFYYFLTERGRAGLTADPRAIAEVIWRKNSPEWHFDDELLADVADSFQNPDYVDVVIHSYRHRLGRAAGAAAYSAIEARLARTPTIDVPAVTLDGMADGNFPATDGTAQAAHFTGPHLHRRIPHAGHNLPQEAPLDFARAVSEVDRMSRSR